MIDNIINATSIHKGGGLTYLFLLHSYIDKSNKLIFLDSRAKPYIKKFKNIKIILLKRGPFRNLKIFFYRLFYISKLNRYNVKTENNKYLTELFFNGLPPLFRIFSKNKKSYIFCQNRLIFEKNKTFKCRNIYDIKTNVYLLIHKIIFNLFKRSEDILIVQNDSMKKLLLDIKIPNRVVMQDKIWGLIDKENYSKIQDLSFKKISRLNNFNIKKIKDLHKYNVLYFYPAYFYPHKNHFKLIKAFLELDKNENKSYKLLLTISEQNYNSMFKNKSPNVVLLNNLSFKDIFYTYRYIDYLIYPSISESFGLPLLEAKFNEIDIIASDLPYVYEICNPFLVFNPNEIGKIFNIIRYSLEINNRLKQ